MAGEVLWLDRGCAHRSAEAVAEKKPRQGLPHRRLKTTEEPGPKPSPAEPRINPPP